MTAVPQVHQLVVDDVVDEARGNLDDAPVQANRTALGLASAVLSVVGDDLRGAALGTGLHPPRLDPFGQAARPHAGIVETREARTWAAGGSPTGAGTCSQLGWTFRR